MKKTPHSKAWPLYRRLFGYIKPFWPILLLGILASAIFSSIDASLTYIMRPLLDTRFIDSKEVFFSQFPLILLVAISVRGLLAALASYCMTRVARSMIKVLRQDVFARIIQLPADYYDEAASGHLLSKILFDVEQVAHVSAEVLTDAVQNTFLILGLFTVLILLSWQLSLLFLLLLPVVGILMNYTNKRVRRVSHKGQKAMADITEIASEAIDGYREVRIFGGLSNEINKFNHATECSLKNDLNVAANVAINLSTLQCLFAIAIAGGVFVAIQMSTAVIVTTGTFVAVIIAMLQIIKPIKSLTSLNAKIQRGLAGAESVFSLLDQAIESNKGIKLNQKVQGKIQFSQVSFAYRHGQAVLHDINISIKSGETVALVGRSGSGKTTIASLLPRFYDLSYGIITLDGIPINEISLSSLREQIALVSQHITLFNDTMASNIAYGRTDVSREQIIAAAKFAYADEFIQRLPNGYDSRIGEDGVLLSGGQRQRLAIARAILKDAPILILDEATSALDSESERYIQDALEKLMKNRTTLVVAHRLSTIKRANKIIVMHQGRVVEQGGHHQLLALHGYYAQLYQAQQMSVDHEESFVQC